MLKNRSFLGVEKPLSISSIKDLKNFVTPKIFYKIKKRLNQFGVDITEVCIKIEKKGLYWFEPAATFITEKETWIQLNPSLFKKSLMRHFYSIEEVLVHEYIHFFRAQIEDSFIEEWLAYQTSSRWYRRWIGPHLHPILWTTLLVYSCLIAAIFDFHFGIWSLPILPLLWIFYQEGKVRMMVYRMNKRTQHQGMASLMKMSWKEARSFIKNKVKSLSVKEHTEEQESF